MDLYVNKFASPAALAAYVNNETIPQANIQAILCRDSMWILFWWA